MKQMPPQRKKVYEFVVSYHASHGEVPAPKQIAEHMGWKHATSATDALYGLRVDGVIKFEWEFSVDDKGVRRRRPVWRLA